MDLNEEPLIQTGTDTFWHDDDPGVVFESNNFASSAEIHELKNAIIRFHNILATLPYDPFSDRHSEVRAPIYANNPSRGFLSATIDADFVTLAKLKAISKDCKTIIQVEGIKIPNDNKTLTGDYYYHYETSPAELDTIKPFDSCFFAAQASAITRQKLSEFSVIVQCDPSTWEMGEDTAESLPVEHSRLKALTTRCMGALGLGRSNKP